VQRHRCCSLAAAMTASPPFTTAIIDYQETRIGRNRRTVSTSTSSSTTVSQNHNHQQQHSDHNPSHETMMATIHRLLKLAPGSFSTYSWRDGRRALAYWASHSHSHPNCQEEGRMLWQRLCRERKELQQRMEVVHSTQTARTIVEQSYPLDPSLLAIFDKNHGSNDRAAQDDKEKVEEDGGGQEDHLVEDDSGSGPSLASEVQRITEKICKEKIGQSHPAAKIDNSALVEEILNSLERDWTAQNLPRGNLQEKMREFRNKSQQTNSPEQAFVLALQMWEQASKHQIHAASRHADKLLYEILNMYLQQQEQQQQHVDDSNDTASISVESCRRCFEVTVQIHVNNRNPQAADRVLSDMIRLYDQSNNSDFLPDRSNFLAVIMSYFQQQPGKENQDRIYKADAILHTWLDVAEAAKDSSMAPPDSLIQHIVTLWAESYERDAGERAESVLLRMQGFRDQQQWPDGKPPFKFFELLLDNWANSYHPKAAERIEKLQRFVKRMYPKTSDQPLSSNHVDKVVPPSFGYLPLLRALSRRTGGKPHSRTVDKFEGIFEEYRKYFESKYVTSLDIILAYKARIHAYDLYLPNKKLAAKQSQKAFQELMDLREKGIVTRDPDATVYGALANAFAKTGNVTKVKQIIQDAGCPSNNIMYNYLLLALSRSKDPTAASQAEELLVELEVLGQEDPSVAPNIRTYGIVMACLANSPDPEAVARAEMYLQKLKDIYAATGDKNYKPNTKIYTDALRAIGRSQNIAAVDKARALLDEMNVLSAQGDGTLKPDVVTYTAMLQVLREADIPVLEKTARAKEIVSLMRQNGVKADSHLHAEARKLNVM